MKKFVKVCVFSAAILLFSISLSYGAITTYFSEVDAGFGIYASATATVTAGAGFVDVAIQNTSPLGGSLGNYANPYITELKFTFPDGLVVDGDNSSVTSKAGSYFAQGADTAALYTADSKTLNYDFLGPDTVRMKKRLTSGDPANNQNDNTIASMNILDGSYIPRDDSAVGFLNSRPGTYSGAVFDTVTFHILFTTDDVVAESFYANAQTLVVKYQGYGSSYHAYNTPEPTTFAILALGALLLRKRTA